MNCSDDALYDLRWETLKSRREQHVLKLVKNCVNGIVPQFLCDYFSFNRQLTVRTTRQRNLFIIMELRFLIAQVIVLDTFKLSMDFNL